MSESDNQPDWAAIAEKFDLWLPQIAPVGDVLLKGLAAQPGDKIIDLGSGTGEPALTLARQMRCEVDITGVDSAGPMVAVAQRKVKDEGLGNVRFMHMPTLLWSYEVLSKRVAEDAVPPLHKVTSLGRPG